MECVALSQGFKSMLIANTVYLKLVIILNVVMYDILMIPSYKEEATPLLLGAF